MRTEKFINFSVWHQVFYLWNRHIFHLWKLNFGCLKDFTDYLKWIFIELILPSIRFKHQLIAWALTQSAFTFLPFYVCPWATVIAQFKQITGVLKIHTLKMQFFTLTQYSKETQIILFYLFENQWLHEQCLPG